MKELKFRIWNNSHNEFIRPDYGLIGFCYPLDGRIAALTSNSDPIEDCDIEQYTGLKDKNGKEIYVGDILEFDKDFDDNAQRYVPFFDEKLAAFGFKIYGYQDYISESGSEEFEPEMSLIGEMENYEREEIILYTEHISIIGNIHENHELLGN